MRVRAAAFGLVATVTTLTLAACASSSGGGTGDGLSVVTSTNVYGQIASVIGADRVDVTSIISDPSADPHSYEANTRTQLELSEADVVIENGGGYDDFVNTMLSGENSHAVVLNAVELGGHAKDVDLNEHVWYDFPSMGKLVTRLVSVLSAADPAGAATYEANGAAFQQQLGRLESTEAAIKQAHAGVGVAITEPVPLYLLHAAGLVDKTPAQFSEAVEEGTDVSPLVLKRTTDLFDRRQVAALVYNEQTSGPETEQVRKAAEANDIPALGVSETLPAGKTYLTWMGDNLAVISQALDGAS